MKNKDKISSGVSAATGTATAIGGQTAAIIIAMTFGTASTGSAISTLSGAAATNAATAWLGGALPAGGFGMGGGTVVLTTITIIGGIAAVSALGHGIHKYYKSKKQRR